MLEIFHNKNVWTSANAQDLLQDKWIYLRWDGAWPSVLYKAPCDGKPLTWLRAIALVPYKAPAIRTPGPWHTRSHLTLTTALGDQRGVTCLLSHSLEAQRSISLNCDLLLVPWTHSSHENNPAEFHCFSLQSSKEFIMIMIILIVQKQRFKVIKSLTRAVDKNLYIRPCARNWRRPGRPSVGSYLHRADTLVGRWAKKMHSWLLHDSKDIQRL